MEKLDVYNLMSYVVNGTDIGPAMTNIETTVVGDVVKFTGEVKHSKKDGYLRDRNVEVNGRVKYLDRDSLSAVAIDINCVELVNGKDVKFGELVSFESRNTKSGNIIVKTSVNKSTNEFSETCFENFSRGVKLNKNYVDTCYNPIAFQEAVSKVKTLSR